MLDEEPLSLPPTAPSSTEPFPTDNSASILDMINQDVMYGSLQIATDNVFRGAARVSPSSYLWAAPFTSAGDVFLPIVPETTVANTFVKHYNEYATPPSASRTAKHVKTLKPRPVNPKSGTSQSANLHSRISNETPSVSNPRQATPVERKRDRSTSKTSSDYRKKRKSHGPHECSSRSKSRNKNLRHSSQIKNIFSIKSPPDEPEPASTRSDSLRSAVTHTVTRATNSVTGRSVAVTTATVTRMATTVAQIVGMRANAISKNATEASCKMSSTIQAAGAQAAAKSTTSQTSYNTVTRARAPRSIISPIKSTYLPGTVIYPTPTIITRTTPGVTLADDRVCEKFTILSTQTEFPIPTIGADHGKSETDAAPRTHTRIVIPASMNPFAASAAAVDTTAASTVNLHRALHAVRSGQNVLSVPSQAASNTSTATARTLTRSSFSLPPGSTLYATRTITKPRSHAAATTEPHTFTIVDSKGAYTTLTFSPDFTTTTTTTTTIGSPLLMTQTQHTTAVTARVSNTSPVVSDSVGRPRSQLFIPIPNSQMNTSTSLGYLVSSPIRSDLITSCSSTVAPTTESVATTATAISSHTITTISSEALNRIRNRLIFNVPSTAAAGPSLPATISPGGNKPRGSVTIIANQLLSTAPSRETGVSAVPSAASAPTAMFPAPSQPYFTTTATITSTVSSPSTSEPSTSSVNRVVIPACHSSESVQGAYIIAGVSPSPPTVRDVVTRSSRVVIPMIHSTSAGTASAGTPATTAATRPGTTTANKTASFSSIVSTDALSKLKRRFTIQIGTTESSSPYTITRTRAPQRSFTIPAGAIYRPSSTKTSESSKSPAASFAPPSTGGAPATGALHSSPLGTRDTPSPAIASVTSATPTITSTGNRFVIKLARSPSTTSSGTTSSVTTSITTPITSAIANPTLHQFVEPHPVPARPRMYPVPRTFPGPRSYSIANKNTTLRPVPHHFNPRFRKPISSPAPLQIFADVVCPPTTALTQTTTTRTNSKSRFTLSHSPGSSNSVSQHKNTGFKCLSTIVHPSSGRTSSRFLGPRASSERLILNRLAALVPPRRPAPLVGSSSARDSRPQHGESTRDSRSHHGESTRDLRSQHGESTRDSRSQHVESTRDSCSQHAESTRDSHSQPAESTRDARSQRADSKRDSRSQHADSKRNSRLQHADSMRDLRSLHADPTHDSRPQHVETTRDSRSQHADSRRDSCSQHAESTAPVTRASPAASDAPQPSTSRLYPNQENADYITVNK